MPDIVCKICGKGFYSKQNWIKRGWGKYCSKKCQYEGQKRGKLVNCFTCSKEVYKSLEDIKNSKSGNFFCSNNIYVGPMHANWRTGISIYRKLLIKTNKQQLCTFCKNDDKRILAVHHIDRNRKNNELTNLIWLCHNCHYLIHHYNRDREKLMEMLV